LFGEEIYFNVSGGKKTAPEKFAMSRKRMPEVLEGEKRRGALFSGRAYDSDRTTKPLGETIVHALTTSIECY